ncbi:MAG: hypothetical protein JWR63_1064 [Conexibacter sp.]|nr:hypothetical protein [Conexibacter sp.]
MENVPARRSPSSVLEANAPVLFAVVGLAMIVAAAVGYLADAVSSAFAIVGAGLLIVGGLAGRLLTFKLTTTGIEGTLAARQVLAEARERAEAEGVEEAAEAFSSALDWFSAYQAAAESKDPSPWVRAAAFQKAYEAHRDRIGRASRGDAAP